MPSYQPLVKGNERAQLAHDIFGQPYPKIHWSIHCGHERVDAIVFTAGIGENSIQIREEVISALPSSLVVTLILNVTTQCKEAIISPEGAKVTVLNVPTNEEMECARS